MSTHNLFCDVERIWRPCTAYRWRGGIDTPTSVMASRKATLDTLGVTDHPTKKSDAFPRAAVPRPRIGLAYQVSRITRLAIVISPSVM